MNRAATTLLIALALTASAVAQTDLAPANTHPNTITVHTTQVTRNPATGTITSYSAPTTLTITAPASNCPIGFSAQPGVAPLMVVVVDGNSTAQQNLNLQLTNPFASIGIKKAQITVHGLTAQGRILPVSSNPDDNTIAKQVDLALTVAPGHHASHDMLFKGFTSIRWITLDSLTYADGSTWHPAPHRSCSIVPSRFMAIPEAITTH
jgi:hypothetical protein